MRNFILFCTASVSVFLSLSTVVQSAELKFTCTKDTGISSYKEKNADERNLNMGATGSIKIKGIEEMAILRFDLSKLKGKKIKSAKLFLCEASTNFLRKIGLSTVSNDWIEGKGNYTIDETDNGATFFEASYKKCSWCWPGSDLTDVTMGNGNTLQQHTEMQKLGDGWIAVDVSLPIVKAIICDASYGILVMDESGQTTADNLVYSRESGNNGPYLVVNYEDANVPPQKPLLVNVKPKPELAHVDKGAVSIFVSVPEDAAAYHIWVDDKKIERWKTPFPAGFGTEQEIVLDDLNPNADIEVKLAVADGAGNMSEPVIVKGKTSAALPATPKLPDLTITGAGVVPPERDGKLRVWAFPEVSKVKPVTGSLDESIAGDYRMKNYVWDGKNIRLFGARAEIIAFQLAIEKVASDLHNVKVAFSDLKNSKGDKISSGKINTFLVWYVNAEGWQEEYAIPLKETENFSVPNLKNNIPGQTNQVVYVDLFIPKNTKAGKYLGKVTISADGVNAFDLPIELTVYDVVIPDELNFNPELNCYSDLNAVGSEKFLDSHRLAHAHRCTLNRVPYAHADSRVSSGFSPRIDGQGKETHIVYWDDYDKNIGPLLDGSAFVDCPRSGVPVKTIYLPLFEGWPTPMTQEVYQYKGTWEGENCITEHAMSAGPVEQLFTQGYKDAFINVTGDFVKHVEEKGWTKPSFQFYLNNKYFYKTKNEGGTSWWLLDEPLNCDDWLALAFFGRLFKQGIHSAKTANFAFRADISRPGWQRDWLNNLLDVMYVGGVFFQKAHRCRIMAEEGNMILYSYGSCNNINESNLNTENWCVASYLNGADGVLPWQSLGRDSAFKEPEQTSLIVDGSTRFGYPVIASLRVKALRRGAQDVEYLILLSKKYNLNREQLRYLVSSKISIEVKSEQKDVDGAEAATFGGLTSQKFSELRESIAKLLVQ